MRHKTDICSSCTHQVVHGPHNTHVVPTENSTQNMWIWLFTCTIRCIHCKWMQ